jgi:ABC-type phosphate transport system substrate-binding protein
MGFGSKSWLRYRVFIYAAVAIGVFLYRNHIDWTRLAPWSGDQEGADPTLVLTGSDLAPGLVDILIEHFRRDYPDLDVTIRPGGTNQALEDLLNGHTDVAFLSRPPTPPEQNLFRQVDGDTAIVVPVGVGAVMILAGSESSPGKRPGGGPVAVTREQLAGLMAGDMQQLGDRLYAADPNLGHWAAAAQLVGRDPEPTDTATVVYLADEEQVARAVANDPRALGLTVSFDLPAAMDSTTGPAIVPVWGPADDHGALPNYESVATGAYPLYVSLFVACRAEGNLQGGKFVTHLASGRGQRQIERAGCIPARQVPHEVFLTNQAVGQ